MGNATGLREGETVKRTGQTEKAEYRPVQKQTCEQE